MRDFTRLEVWQRARDLTRDVYRASARFPAEERFGLTKQIRHASASIGANVAEGSGRGSDTDYARFVRYAGGSANEVEHHLIVAGDQGFLPTDEILRLRREVASVRAMLSRLEARLLRRSG